MTIVNFTPWTALVGGIFIGLATTVFFLVNGRLFGISGVIGNLVNFEKKELPWRLAAFVGLFTGAFIASKVYPIETNVLSFGPIWKTVLAGLLVGFGTRFGNGCTSGHGVCGLSRFSLRSLVATCTFMGFGFLTVWILKFI